MYQWKGLDDTIAAIATAPGPGGIGIVRVSGPAALEIAGRIFEFKKPRPMDQCRSHRVYYGYVRVQGEVIDEALLTVMKAPRSYTCQDVVEINCHGGPAAVRAVLRAVMDNGARLAEPGEFTRRAFLNGRIDLTQAEAVLDIIQSKTEGFLRLSTHQLKGELTARLEEIRVDLMNVYTELEAIINFPEDDIQPQSRDAYLKILGEAGNRIRALLATADQGRVLKEGIRIVLVGRPNVGKSSLLNALLRQPRAIVSEIAGTTRDTIEETAQIGGVPVQLVDTAGILEPRDLIEEEAVRRSRQHLAQADLVLLILENSAPLSETDRQLIDGIKGRAVLTVINKCDLSRVLSDADIQRHLSGHPHVRISARSGEGMEELRAAVLRQALDGPAPDGHELLVSNLRHVTALKEADGAITEAAAILRGRQSLEIVSEEIKRAVNALDAITGRRIDEDLLDQIFSAFCIGK